MPLANGSGYFQRTVISQDESFAAAKDASSCKEMGTPLTKIS